MLWKGAGRAWPTTGRTWRETPIVSAERNACILALPLSVRARISSGLSESRVRERTKDTCTPRERCSPAHCMHSRVPYVTETQGESSSSASHLGGLGCGWAAKGGPWPPRPGGNERHHGRVALLPRVLLWDVATDAWAHSKHLSLPGSSIISTISPGPRLRPTCAPSLTASTLLEASRKSPRPSPCLSPPDFGTGALPLTHLVGGAGCESLASTVSRACEAGRQLTRGLFLIPRVRQCNPTPWVYPQPSPMRLGVGRCAKVTRVTAPAPPSLTPLVRFPQT